MSLENEIKCLINLVVPYRFGLTGFLDLAKIRHSSNVDIIRMPDFCCISQLNYLVGTAAGKLVRSLVLCHSKDGANSLSSKYCLSQACQ